MNWVLMRGLARHSAHWGPFRDLLVKRFPQDRFEFMDVRGNGTLNGQKSYLRISQSVDDLRLRCPFTAKGEKINLVAISMGGMMAVDWARRYPEEVQSVVCINTSDQGTSHFWDRLRPSSLKLLFKILLHNTDPVKREELSLDLITNLVKDKKKIAQEFSTLAVTSRENFFRQLFAASQFRFPKEKPPVPVLLLCSQGDRMVSSSCTVNIAAQWKMTPQIHPLAGHDLPLDDPQWLLDQISGFQRSLTKSI